MINVAIVREPCDNHRGARAYIEAATGHHGHTACFEQHCIVCIEWSWEKTCHSVKDGWEISSPPLATHRTSLATPLTLRHYAPLPPSFANCLLFSTVCREFKLEELFSYPNWRWPGIFMIFRTSSPSEQCLPTPTQQDAALFLIWWGFWTGVGCTCVTLSAKCGKRSVEWFDFLQFVTRPRALSCEQDYHHDHRQWCSSSRSFS